MYFCPVGDHVEPFLVLFVLAPSSPAFSSRLLGIVLSVEDGPFLNLLASVLFDSICTVPMNNFVPSVALPDYGPLVSTFAEYTKLMSEKPAKVAVEFALTILTHVLNCLRPVRLPSSLLYASPPLISSSRRCPEHLTNAIQFLFFLTILAVEFLPLSLRSVALPI